MLEIFRAFGEALAVELLLLGCAAVAKMHGRLIPPPPDKFTQQQRAGFPASIARAVALIRDIGLASKFQLPAEYFEETEAQFPGAAGSLNVEQIRELGELGIATKHFGLAWEASAAGLDRGGAAEAYFLLLRARALPDGYADRYDALTAAAAELSRFHRDMEVIDRAVEAGRDPFDDTPFTLTLDQARDVLAKEKASPAFPSRNNPGPDYSSLFGEALCMCPGCRSERGEFSDPYSFEEDGEPIPDLEEMERSFYAAAPKDVPREMLPALFEVAKQAFFTGQEPEDLLSEIFASTGGRKKKGKRR